MSTNSTPIFTEAEINILFDALDKHTISPEISEIFDIPNNAFGRRSFIDGIFENIDATKAKFEKKHRENKEAIRNLQSKLVALKNAPVAAAQTDNPDNETSNA